MRVRNWELELAYLRETGKQPAVEGVWIETVVKHDSTGNCRVIIDWDEFPEETMNEISQRAGFSIPDVDYLAWLENKLTINSIKR